jgi:ketosteroid isomerase-like protein
VILDHPHVRLAETVWRAVSEGDAETLSEVCIEDLAWHASGRGTRSGSYRGQQAVFSFLASIGEDAEHFDLTLEDILVSDERVCVLFHVNGLRKGRRPETSYALLFRIEGSRLAEVWSVARDQYAVDEFWA